MKSNIIEKIKALTPKEVIMAMVEGLQNPKTKIDMGSFGQKELVNSSQLPVKVNGRLDRDIKGQYALMGIKVIDYTKGDELFYDVIMPEGWKKEPTDHSMWSKLIDNKGRERISIFYKAAFYDRDSFANFTTRYNWNGNHEKEGYISYIVKDNSTGTVIFETEDMVKDYERPDYFEIQNVLQRKCIQFLEENFPNYKDINAYWD